MSLILNGIKVNKIIWNNANTKGYYNGRIIWPLLTINLNNGSWYEDTSKNFDGYKVFRSKAIGNNGSTTMYIYNSSGMSVTFKYIADSENNYDFLRIYDSNNTQIASSTSTHTVTNINNYATLTTSTTTIKLTYSKDRSQASGSDAGYVAIPIDLIGEIQG